MWKKIKEMREDLNTSPLEKDMKEVQQNEDNRFDEYKMLLSKSDRFVQLDIDRYRYYTKITLYDLKNEIAISNLSSYAAIALLQIEGNGR